ncbi:MAG: MAPEG family protein, partial [Gammaproteobacteria bacterium]|nr:MAPEG family protein [Gammaproteobacteria bacterium]
MTATATALLGFAGWSLLLVFSIALYRSRIGLSQKKALNSFSATGDDLPP